MLIFLPLIVKPEANLYLGLILEVMPKTSSSSPVIYMCALVLITFLLKETEKKMTGDLLYTFRFFAFPWGMSLKI